MPKIKDLGITVVPEGFGPVEIGPGGCGCTNVTNPCLGCTRNWTFACGWRSYYPCPRPSFCTDCTFQNFSICGTTPRTNIGAVECAAGTVFDPLTPVCAGSRGPELQVPQLTREQISQIRTDLTQHLAALDEAEKALLPKTTEELEAREKELAAELDKLKAVRADLKKK